MWFAEAGSSAGLSVMSARDHRAKADDSSQVRPPARDTNHHKAPRSWGNCPDSACVVLRRKCVC
jgi:hypothetical protein